ncbi:PGDYG domain-containing protein [Fredinandcohnia sp. FSL W7-1320]|uniref:PGDYG domain-containing protein n=1 Tax=Fredinandcohnia sp. FSL W7-1320 TaxID=2954540 RepID=UPI001FE85EA8
MPKYRKKPIVVEAVKLTGPITIETSNGSMKGLPGDYLITDKDGEQYPCDRDQFEAEYEPVKGVMNIKRIVRKSIRLIKTKMYKT